MPWGYAAAAVGTIVAADMGAGAQEDAANSASAAQERTANRGLDLQEKQFSFMQETLAPYVKSGGSAMAAQLDLLGIGAGGAAGQRAAIDGLASDPTFKALQQQSEDALLQNASATGGLRGGNTQSALAQLRPALLQQLLSDRMNRLGGLSSMGQASAAGQAAGGQQYADSSSALLSQLGASQAGAYVAGGAADASRYGAVGGAIGTMGMLYGMNNGGRMSPSAVVPAGSYNMPDSSVGAPVF